MMIKYIMMFLVKIQFKISNRINTILTFQKKYIKEEN